MCGSVQNRLIVFPIVFQRGCPVAENARDRGVIEYDAKVIWNDVSDGAVGGTDDGAASDGIPQSKMV